MKTWHWLALLGAIVIVCGGMTLHYRSALARLRADFDALPATTALTPQPAQKTVATARTHDPFAEEIAIAETAAETDDIAAADQEEDNANPFAKMISGMMKDPQMKEMIRNQQKMVARQMYAGLNRRLTMDGETRSQLDDLLAERQATLAELGMEMMNGEGGSPEELAATIKETKDAFDQQIKDLLGDEAYEAFAQYEEMIPEQTSITLFKNNLSSDETLTEQQEDELIELMYAARKDMPENALMNQTTPDPTAFTPEKMEEAVTQMKQLQTHYVDSAAAILDERQLKRFKEWQEQMAVMQDMGIKMMGNMMGQEKAK